MKIAIVLADGMADRPLDIFNGHTPLEAAVKPNINRIALKSERGLYRTLYDDLPAGSDVANLSVLGYDPHLYYTGRSPIEALGLGLPVDDGDTVFRMNLVTLSEDEPFADKVMVDNSAGKISTPEAEELVAALSDKFGTDLIKLYPGVTYRHVFILKHRGYSGKLTPPHDILGRRIGEYLPSGELGRELTDMTEQSFAILSEHPVNLARQAAGLRKANALWLWGDGGKPRFKSFKENCGVEKGMLITAVPLIKGLAVGMGLASPDVPGATGEYDTNYAGKADTAISAFKDGYEFVFIHVEAPDECGHDGDAELKKASIEQIDRHIVGPVFDYLSACGDDFRMLVTPDHATPVCVRTHTREPIPYLYYDSRVHVDGGEYSESAAAETGKFMPDAFRFMERLTAK